jgi:glycosyltransferase involved in cell wall biosynthesis
VVPCHDDGQLVREAVRSVQEAEPVEVVVVDDGSADLTSGEARDSGARLFRPPRRVGKGTALEGALGRVQKADVYVLADADLGRSAALLAPLLDEVLAGRADLAVANLPPPRSGGFGLVKRTAGWLVHRLTGFRPLEPLSGQRAVTRECLEACRPLAPGFGVELGMTADAIRMGFALKEIPAALEHRFTRKDVPGFAHRARQGVDAVRAAAPRALRLR